MKYITDLFSLSLETSPNFFGKGNYNPINKVTEKGLSTTQNGHFI